MAETAFNSPPTRADLAAAILKVTGGMLALSDAVQASAEGNKSQMYSALAEATKRVNELHDMFDTLMGYPR